MPFTPLARPTRRSGSLSPEPRSDPEPHSQSAPNRNPDILESLLSAKFEVVCFIVGFFGEANVPIVPWS